MKDEIRFWLYVARALGQAALEREGDAIWLTGKEKHTGEPLSVFYYGRLLAYDWLVQHFYAEHAVERIEEDMSIRAGMRLLQHETASDLVIGDLSWPYYRGLPRTRFLLVPPVIAHTQNARPRATSCAKSTSMGSRTVPATTAPPSSGSTTRCTCRTRRNGTATCSMWTRCRP
jgi:hypothetical protein